jgi:hypothetical protein
LIQGLSVARGEISGMIEKNKGMTSNFKKRIRKEKYNGYK